MPIVIRSKEQQLQDRIELIELAAELDARTRRRYLDNFFGITGDNSRFEYPKHLQFFKAGATHHQRLFMAANRVGKTLGKVRDLRQPMNGGSAVSQHEM
jgi:hypothetical protein